MTHPKYLWYQKVRKENICGIRTVSSWQTSPASTAQGCPEKSRQNLDPINEETSLWLLQAMQNHIPYIYFIFLNLERKYKSSNFRLSFNFLFFFFLSSSRLFFLSNSVLKMKRVSRYCSTDGCSWSWANGHFGCKVAGSLTCNSVWK